jgi:hypothetical protein
MSQENEMSQAIDSKVRERNLLFMTDPKRWSHWPFLPLMRSISEQDYDCGLLCDLEKSFGLSGFRCTVFVCNLFEVPPTLQELLALPKETFDTFEELLAAGWRIDGPDLVVIAVSP